MTDQRQKSKGIEKLDQPTSHLDDPTLLPGDPRRAKAANARPVGVTGPAGGMRTVQNGLRRAPARTDDPELTDESEPIVWVRRQWNDWRDAAYRLEDVSGWHYDNTSGGIRARANRTYLHAYVWCDGMISGELAHSCLHGQGPHRIKICVVKYMNKGFWPAIQEAVEAERARLAAQQSRGT